MALISLPLPPPLMTSEPGSFARATIVERKPQIIRQVLADHDYPPVIRQALEAFCAEITSLLVQSLCEEAPDVAVWNAELARYVGRTWLELPWYFAEVYFYRRLLEATQYFQPGPWYHQDPFHPQKQRPLAADAAWFGEVWGQLAGLNPDWTFEVLLHSSLWGNRADLSHFAIQEQALGGLAAQEERYLVLIDHTAEVYTRLHRAGHVAFINDNVGKELLFDLALAGFLLEQGWGNQVTFHLKDRPFFVSDAMSADARAAVAALVAAFGPAHILGERLAGYLRSGQLRLQEHPFWTGFRMFTDLPSDLRAELAAADLVLVKGDANYRRIVSDAHWPFTARLEQIAAYFPAPFVSLRTLKSEVMVGLQPGEAESLAASDPAWLTNGKRGIIHFVNPGE